MHKRNILQRVTDYNGGRNPAFVHLKYKTLLESPFKFFRGTCHLFYEDTPADSFILSSPKTWICGDMHLENFGSFKGVHRLYFDMNDFDEALLAPCLFDIVRLCTSIFLISHSIAFSKSHCRKLIRAFLLSYSHTLGQGDPDFLEQNTARGFLKEFLEKVNTYNRRQLLRRKIRILPDKVRLKCDDIKAFKATKAEKKKVKDAIKKWVVQNCMDPDFFKVLDVAVRTAGVASIGIERYIVLVKGNKKEGHYLLDIKESLPACALRYFKFRQPKWGNDAKRIIAIQKRVQAAEPIFLSEISFDQKNFVIQELQPEEDSVNYMMVNDFEKFIHLMHDMGSIVAWNTLRCGGRQGSAIADDLIRFSKRIEALEPQILEYSESYAQTTVNYWKEYKRLFKEQLKAGVLQVRI